jgi:hypothetical protein
VPLNAVLFFAEYDGFNDPYYLTTHADCYEFDYFEDVTKEFVETYASRSDVVMQQRLQARTINSRRNPQVFPNLQLGKWGFDKMENVHKVRDSLQHAGAGRFGIAGLGWPSLIFWGLFPTQPEG